MIENTIDEIGDGNIMFTYRYWNTAFEWGKKYVGPKHDVITDRAQQMDHLECL